MFLKLTSFYEGGIECNPCRLFILIGTIKERMIVLENVLRYKICMVRNNEIIMFIEYEKLP
jgi:hypothetical protein